MPIPWITHTRNEEDDDNRLSYLATEFLFTGDDACLNWLRLCDLDKPQSTTNFRRELDSYSNLLYYTSLGSLVNAVSRLVEEGVDVSAKGARGRYRNAL